MPKEHDQPSRLYLIWSNEHMMWWRPARCGYTSVLAEAGQYTAEEAREICAGRGRLNNPPDEVAVLDPRLKAEPASVTPLAPPAPSVAAPPRCKPCENGERVFLIAGKCFHAGTGGDSYDVPCPRSFAIGSGPTAAEGERACEMKCPTCFPRGGFHQDGCPNQPGGAFNNRFEAWPIRDKVPAEPAGHPAPPANYDQSCLICGHARWADRGVWHEPSGVFVCKSCRDRAAQPALSPEEPRLPQKAWDEYDDAVDKAASVGAMKRLKNVEAAIGRWYVENFNDAAVAKRGGVKVVRE